MKTKISQRLFKSHERLQETSAAYWHHKHRMRYEFCKSFAAKRVLDAGCGTGYGADYLAQGAQCVVGVDKDQPTIREARKKYPRQNLHFSVMDCTKLGLCNATFDLVCSFEVIEHVEQHQKYLNEMKRILKDKGIFIMSTPNRECAPFAMLCPYHFHVFSPDELHTLLARFFRRVEIYGQESSTPAMRLYRSPIIRISFRIARSLGLKALVPPCLKRVQRAMERLFTRSTLEEAERQDFTISKGTLERSDNLIAVCSN